MKPRWPWVLPVILVALDRGTKWLIESRVQPWETFPVIPGLFQIVHTRNTGIAFGMFASEQGSNRLLIAFSLAIMAFVGFLLWKAVRHPESEHWTMRAALSLVLGGAIGNLYDRIVFGSVTDFLDFFWGSHHFPIFNIADGAITSGAALLLLNLWFVRKPTESSEAGASSAS